jgi:hypothetical protein
MGYQRWLKKAVAHGARGARRIPHEERKAIVILVDLDYFAVRESLPAPGTLAALRPGDGGGDDMQAASLGLPILEVPAFTALASTAENYLVNRGCIVLAGDEPYAVLVRDLVGMLPVEFPTSLDPGLGFWRGVR